MAPSPSLRHAVPDDVDDLLDLWATAGENASRPADRPDLVRRLMQRDPEAVVVAVLDGRIVGSVIAGWDGWRANVYRLAVAPPLRGRGLGRALLEAAEARLVGLGAERLCAMVLDDNEQGQALYRATGWSPQAEWSRWTREPDLATSADGTTHQGAR